MKIYVNPMDKHTDEQVERIIKGDVIDYFGPGGESQRKYVVINEIADEESGDENDDVLMFEGTLEECHIYSEIARVWVESSPAIYSEELYRRLWQK